MTSTDNVTVDQATGWRAVTGSARGALHHSLGLPNQDSVACHAGPDGVVVAVADGHGHVRHFRSEAGSALAVDVARRTAVRITARLTAGADGPEMAEAAAAVRDELAPAIVDGWRTAVAADLASRPYSGLEQEALGLAGDDPEVPYGSTLLVAAIAADWLVCAQIGDGDLLAVGPDGQAFSPVAPDDRLDGLRTTSLCQPDAVTSFRASALDLRQVPLLAVLLATDGYGNAQADEPWQPGVGRDLAAFAAEYDQHWFGQQVPAWARRCASAEGSGDDATVALLLRSPAARPAPAPGQRGGG